MRDRELIRGARQLTGRLCDGRGTACGGRVPAWGGRRAWWRLGVTVAALVGVWASVQLGCAVPGKKEAQRGVFPAAEEQALGLELVWPLPLRSKSPVKDIYRLPGTLCVVNTDNTFVAIDPEKGNPLWTQYLDDTVRLRATEAGDKLYLVLGARLLTLDKATAASQERRLDFVASSPPAVDSLYVYLGAAGGRLRALNLGPRIGWQQTVGSTIMGRPQVDTAGVYFASNNGRVYAVNVADGTRKWEFQTDRAVVADLVLQRNVLYVGSRDGRLYALDTALAGSRKQQQRWLLPYSSGGDIQKTPLVRGDAIFVVDEQTGVHAVRADDGTGLWRCPQADSFIATAGDRVFLGVGGRQVLCLDRETGKVLWERRLPAKFLFVANGEDDLIYFCRERDGCVYCYRAR